MTYPHNVNDTEPGGLLTEQDFEHLSRKSWFIPEPPTKFERVAAVPLAVAIGILGAVALIHWALS
jgi:hypothetical protein